ILGDLGEEVRYLRVREALEQCGTVARDVELRESQVPGGLIPERLHRLTAHRVGEGLGHGRVPAQLARVREHRMPAVQQPQLAVLERFDVLNEQRPGVLPCGPASRELAGEDPAREGFGDYG